MTTSHEDYRKAQFDKFISACGQLGSYGSLMNYAIDALKGKTSCTPQEVAAYLEARNQELVEEQNVSIFKS